MGLDWGDGDYARTAESLMPAARALVDAAGVGAGSRVLDVACGTGNAALLAAQRAAEVVGVDASARLMEQAGARAAADGARARFVVGDAMGLPVADAEFDVALSVFGVVFAPDGGRAIAEMLRALRPGGVLAITTWLPEGEIAAAGRVLRQAVPPADAPPQRWDDPGWLRDLLESRGARAVQVQRAGELVFTADSASAWFAEQEQDHPVWRWARRTLDDPAAWDRVRELSVAALGGDARPLRVVSPYLVARAER